MNSSTESDPHYPDPGSQRLLLLSAIVEASSDAIISKDLSGIVQTWNRGAQRIFGFTPEEAIGRHISLIIPTDRAEEENEILTRLRRGERIEHYITVRRRKDGRDIDVSITVSPVRDAEGRIVGASKIARDITDVLRANHARAQLAAIVDASDDAIISKGLDGIIRSWNAAAERLFGYSAAEAIGQPITLIIPPDRLDEEREIISRLKRGERIEHFETVRRRKDGSFIDLALTISPVRDTTGAIIGASKIARDITDRKKSDQTRAQLAAIVDASDDAIVSKGLDGFIRSWNAAAERLFGYTAEEAIGKHITLIIPPERQDEERQIIARLCRGERIEHFETVRVRKDGRLLHLSLTISPVRDSAGRITGASKIARDISERKRAEEALRESTAALQRANQELERFVSIASHDLKEPLRGMSLLASLLLEEEKGLSNAAKGRLERICALSQRLAHMVDGLLQYARAAGERVSEPCDLEQIARGALDKIADRLDSDHAQVDIRAPLPVIEGDPLLLERMFANLIINGVKYNHSDIKRVEIGLRGRDIYIRDNGVGIDPRYHERLFGLFRRMREAEERVGIGLALVHNIVRSHRGTIWVDSQPGSGSTFWIRFPLLGDMPREVYLDAPAAAEPV